MGLCGVCRGKRAMDDRTDLARCQQGPDMLAQRSCNCTLERHGTRTQCRPRDGEALAQHQSRIEAALHAPLHGDDDDPAILGQAFDFAGNIVTRHHIEHHVNTTRFGDSLRLGHKVLGLVVDGVVRTQRKASRALFIAARRGDHGGTERTGKLDGGHANAARAALHQQGFPRLQTRTVKDIAPHREERLRK